MILLSWHAHKVTVRGDYQLEILVSQYNNPDGRCAGCGQSRGCCDGFELGICRGDEKCDNFFVFCLRPYQTSSTNLDFCPLGRSSTPLVIPDAPEELTFSSGNRTLLGLDNPVVFIVPGRWTVSIYPAARVA